MVPRGVPLVGLVSICRCLPMGVFVGPVAGLGGWVGLLGRVGSVRVWFAWQRGLIGQVTERVELGFG